MGLAQRLKKISGAPVEGQVPQSAAPVLGNQRSSVYDQDGMRSHHDHSFMADPSFLKAYGRGVQAAGEYGWNLAGTYWSVGG